MDEQKKEKSIIEIDGIQYRLLLTEGVVEAVEQTLGTSLMALLRTTSMMLPLTALRTIYTLCLSTVDGERVKQNKAQELFKKIQSELGYAEMCALVVEAFEHDCPFFFQVN